jgi:hypothetical protein
LPGFERILRVRLERSSVKGNGSDSAILQVNERIKHAATALTAWGNALIIAAGGKWALTGFDPFVPLWFVCALALIWTASQSLTMLQEAE